MWLARGSRPPAARCAWCRWLTSGADLCRSVGALATEIGFRHRRVAPHPGGRAFGNLAAEIEHMHPVGNIHDNPHLVLDHQHGDAELVADIEHKACDVLGLL